MIALIGLLVGAFVLLLWADWRARRRVRPVRAAEVTPEQIRYVSARRDKENNR
nr:hypothetical protein KitaXyl93_20350 [Kitasatospora sp. Xyl93]